MLYACERESIWILRTFQSTELFRIFAVGSVHGTTFLTHDRHTTAHLPLL